MNNKIGLYSLGCFILLWIFQYFITVDVPRWDDFHGILVPVDILLGKYTFAQKFTILFSQNNEHRVAVDRIMLWLITILTGKANMKTLAMIGTILVLFIEYLIVKSSRFRRLDLNYLIPIPFILFAPHYWEILQSLMVPFQIFSVIFFSFLAFYLVANKRPILYCILSVLFAVFSHGNGLLSLPLVALVLVAQRDFKALKYWGLFSIIIISFYFTGYVKPAWNPNISPLKAPLASFLYFFEFIGSASLALVNLSASWTASSMLKVLPTISGLILFFLFFSYFFKKYPFKASWQSIKDTGKLITLDPFDTFIITCILFFFGTGVLMSLSRTGYGMASRYVINSQILICLIYLFIINFIRNKKIVSIVFTFSIIYWIICYFNYWAPSLNMKNSALADAQNWQKNHSWFAQYPDEPQQISNLNHLLDEPYKNGIYAFPKSRFDLIKNSKLKSDSISLEFENNEGRISVNGFKDEERKILQTYSNFLLLLKSENSEFLIPFDYKKNGLTNAITANKYFNEYLDLKFNIRCLPNGDYKTFIVSWNGETYDLIPSNLEFKNENSGLKDLKPELF